MSRIRARAARLTARRSALVVVGVVVGALFVPHGAAVAQKVMQEVIVANGIDNPVPTRDRELAENSNVNPIHTREPKLAENSNRNPLHTREPKLAENSSTNPLHTRLANPEGDPANVKLTPKVYTVRTVATAAATHQWNVGYVYFPVAKISVPEGKVFTVRFYNAEVRTPGTDCTVRWIGINSSIPGARVRQTAQKVGPQDWVVADSESLLQDPTSTAGMIVCSKTSSSKVAVDFTITGELTDKES